MKKIFIILFTLISFNAFAVDKSTTFSNEVFEKAQAEGKIVVINSWNKTCYTCGKQVKILNEAEKEFTDVLFLSFEQTKDKEIATFLSSISTQDSVSRLILTQASQIINQEKFVHNHFFSTQALMDF